MKSLLLTLVFAISLTTVHAQEQDYTIAVSGVAALPIGKRGSEFNFGFGTEIMYMKALQKGYQVGGSLGYTHYTVDEELEDALGFDDGRFLPIAIKGTRAIGDLGFGVGADIGYAIGLNDGNNGGFMYEPKAYLETSRFIASLGYRGILAEPQNLHAIQFGFAVKLN